MCSFYTFLYIFYYFIQIGLSQVNTQEDIEVIANEGSILQLNFYNLIRKYDTCGNEGHCESEGKPRINLRCILNETQETNQQFISAWTVALNNVTNYAGTWICTFLPVYRETYGNTTHENPVEEKHSVRVKVPVQKQTEEVIATGSPWPYIGGGIGALAAVVMIVQTVLILYFKKQAHRRRMRSLQSSATVDSPDETVRYTKMPVQIKVEQSTREPRAESVIYEALEAYPPQKPEPPPIDTLPRAEKKNSEAQQTSLTRKPMRPPTAKKPMKNKAEIMSTTSLERIKARKPHPLPMDDYEVMTPPDDIAKPESGLNRVFPGKLPAQAVPVFPKGNKVPMLPSQVAAAQLKPVTKTKVPPNKTTIPPNRTTMPPNKTTIPSNKTTIPPNKTTIPPTKTTIPPLTTTIPPNTTRQQIIPEPKKTAPFIHNAIKKPQPVQPVFRKPPALLPIQPIPENNGSISSDEEEWTYEPLTHYNDENIYDNVPR